MKRVRVLKAQLCPCVTSEAAGDQCTCVCHRSLPWVATETARRSSRGRRPILGGIKVVELATVIAAPSCAAVLADFGADVTKVEAPGGDMWRGFGANFGNENRGKKSVVIDIKEPEQLAVLKAMIADSDIFVTNVRGAPLKRVGLDYETIHAANPKLIYAQLSAWGQTGPMSVSDGAKLQHPEPAACLTASARAFDCRTASRTAGESRLRCRRLLGGEWAAGLHAHRRVGRTASVSWWDWRSHGQHAALRRHRSRVVPPFEYWRGYTRRC